MISVSQPILGEDESAAVDLVMRSGLLAQGREVAAFEGEFSESLAEGRRSIAVSSGTAALHMGLLALGIGAGDEVIVPSFTVAATANAVALTGATPVFADIEPRYFCLDPEAVEAAITPRTRAVMPVHLFGHPAQLDRLEQVCSRHDLYLIEDAAQAHAARLHDRYVGTWGAVGCFSFYPTKNMTSGEGGMIVTDDESVERSVRLLRNQGQERRYENEVVGFNYRMTDLHAAIGRVQLGRLDVWTVQRQQNALFLDSHLEGVVIPPVARGAEHVYHQYTIRVVGHDRDAFARALAERGVGTGVYYPVPVHRLPSFASDIDLPVSAQAAGECLSLPVHPNLTSDDLEAICSAVVAVANAGS